MLAPSRLVHVALTPALVQIKLYLQVDRQLADKPQFANLTF